MPSTYESGDCTIHTRNATTHELYYHGSLIAVFATFRAAVRYQLEEFP